MSARNAGRWLCLLGAVALALALYIPEPAAAAPETDPAAEEESEFMFEETPEAADDQEATEETDIIGDEEGAEEEQIIEEEDWREPSRRRDGAAARRELLFREGIGERERTYPDGLGPYAPVERSDLDAFDARQRGRDAQVLRATGPGLAVDTSVTAGFQIDDNPLLQSSEEVDGEDTAAWGFIVQPRLAVRRRSPRTLLQSVVRLKYDQLNRFEEDSSDDLTSFDQYAGVQLDAFGPHNAINVFANIANATARTELVEETSVGLTNDNTLTAGGGGAYKHALTANSVIQFSGAIRRQDVGSPLLEDSTFYDVAVDYRTLVTTTGAFGVGAIYERFVPDGNLNPNVDIITGLLSWSDNISPRVSIYFEGGAQVIMSEEVFRLVESETDVTAYIRAQVNWMLSEQDSFLFRASRSADPNPTGQVRIDNQFDLAYYRQMTREIAIGVPFRVLYQELPIGNQFDNRVYFEFRPNLIWGFAPGWGLSTEYRFRLDDEEELSVATSNAFFLSVGYFGQVIP